MFLISYAVYFLDFLKIEASTNYRHPVGWTICLMQFYISSSRGRISWQRCLIANLHCKKPVPYANRDHVFIPANIDLDHTAPKVNNSVDSGYSCTYQEICKRGMRKQRPVCKTAAAKKGQLHSDDDVLCQFRSKVNCARPRCGRPV